MRIIKQSSGAERENNAQQLSKLQGFKRDYNMVKISQQDANFRQILSVLFHFTKKLKELDASNLDSLSSSAGDLNVGRMMDRAYDRAVNDVHIENAAENIQNNHVALVNFMEQIMGELTEDEKKEWLSVFFEATDTTSLTGELERLWTEQLDKRIQVLGG